MDRSPTLRKREPIRFAFNILIENWNCLKFPSLGGMFPLVLGTPWFCCLPLSNSRCDGWLTMICFSVICWSAAINKNILRTFNKKCFNGISGCVANRTTWLQKPAGNDVMQPFFSWYSIGYPANDLVSSWLSQWRQKLNSKFCSTSPNQPQASVLAHLAAQGTRTWVSPHARSITTNRFGRILLEWSSWCSFSIFDIWNRATTGAGSSSCACWFIYSTQYPVIIPSYNPFFSKPNFVPLCSKTECIILHTYSKHFSWTISNFMRWLPQGWPKHRLFPVPLDCNISPMKLAIKWEHFKT